MFGGTLRRVACRVLAGLALWIAALTPAIAEPAFALRWQVERNQYAAEAPDGRSLARFDLTLTDGARLPATGWALYFNCLSGVELGPVDGNLELQPVVGTLYRLVPRAGFQPVESGQTLVVRFQQPEVILHTTRAPTGPYLVLDEAAGQVVAASRYELVMPAGSEPVDGQPPADLPRVTVADLYARNAALTALAPSQVPSVFPTPQFLQPGTGVLHWTVRPAVLAPAALRAERELAARMLEHYLPAGPAHSDEPAVHLAIGPVEHSRSPEAYELVVDARGGVRITGNSAAGVAHGVATLHELLPLPGDGAVDLPAVTVRDAPRFAYRGLMLDVARNFQSPELVMRTLDLMARYKLNVLHFHLIDDEGWRLEIPGLPELTQVGARRGHTLDSAEFLPPAYGSGPTPDDPHGSGHYTRAEYLAILRHAARLHIEVIPEIEMPGHARAAVKSMEARTRRLRAAGDAHAERYLLTDPDDGSRYESAQGYTDNVMNPAMPGTYAFIEHVVAQIAAMHREAGVPLRTIHVGGDEVPRGAWSGSPRCAALMQQHGYTDVAQLWDHFQSRVDAILRKQGLRASGWEELGAMRAAVQNGSRLVPNPAFVGRGFTLYVWNNLGDDDDLAYRLANAGYDVVLAPATRLYLDMSAYPMPGEAGVAWAAHADLDAPFDFVPLDDLRRSRTDATPLPGKERLNDGGRAHVRGIEGTLFAETIRERTRFDFLLMPRLLALAERAWAPDPDWTQVADPDTAAYLHARAWNVFVNQLGQRVLPRLDLEGTGIEYRIPPPGLRRDGVTLVANLQLPGLALRYTTDGTAPTAASPLVTGPLPDVAGLRVAAFDRNGRAGRPVGPESVH